jgi:phosphoenolpyruvate-protein kinase (PTS system EI component)
MSKAPTVVGGKSVVGLPPVLNLSPEQITEKLPAIVEAGAPIFGKPKTREEQELFVKAMRALEFSMNMESLKRVVEHEKDIGVIEGGDFKKLLEGVVGHEVTTSKQFFRDLQRTIIDGSEQRWMLYGHHEPFKGVMTALDRRLKEVGAVTEERIKCESGGVVDVVFGRAYRIEGGVTVDKRRIGDEEVPKELDKAKKLYGIAQQKATSGDPFDEVYGLVLSDLLAGTGDVGKATNTGFGVPSAVQRIMTDKVTLEHALEWASVESAEVCAKNPNKMIQARADDMTEAAKWGMKLLSGVDPEQMANKVMGSLKSNTILVVGTLDASTTKKYAENERVFGIVPKDAKSLRGHIGKTFGEAEKVAVSTEGGLLEMPGVRTGEMIIIDTTGKEPVMIISPTVDTISQMEKRKQKMDALKERMKQTSDKDCVTKDGIRVRLAGNVESVFGCRRVGTWGGDGIILVRTENVWAKESQLPNAEAQAHEYREMASQFSLSASNNKKNSKVRFRFIDVGRDKVDYEWLRKIRETEGDASEGVEFLLKHKDILKEQTKAFMLASVQEAMIPMVQTVGQLSEALEVVEAAKRELRAEGKTFNEKMAVGIMTETPAAVDALSALLKIAKFQSMGTNDYAHYSLGRETRQDRPDVDPYAPSVFNGIYRTIYEGVRRSVPTSICGDMASKKLGAVTLLGMYEVAMEELGRKPSEGITPELSMTAIRVPVIKELLMGVEASKVKGVVREVLALSHPKQSDPQLKSEADVIRELTRGFTELGINLKEELDS